MGQLVRSDLLARVPGDVHELCARLREAGWRAWIVGGCTRDLLLHRPVHDWDVATDALPSDVSRVFRRVIPTGEQHGTVTVMIHKTGYEVTTLRGEGAYTDGRHPDSVTFVKQIDDDLARRDFTVNAIALDPLTGVVSDPFHGMADIQAAVIRTVGEPHQRFGEDGLRIMRAARFSATLGFSIDPSTLQGMRHSADTLRKVSTERVRDEILKSMRARRPSRAFNAMRDADLIGIVLPELQPTIGCEQNRYHKFDVWTHTMHCLDAAVGDPVLRLAVLLHDVGKPVVRAHSDKTHDYTFYGHELVGARIASAICDRLRMSTEDRQRVVAIVRHHLVVYEPSWTDAAVRRWLVRIGPERVDDIIAMACADAHGKGVDPGPQMQPIIDLRDRVEALHKAGLALTAKDLKIDGHKLMSELQIAPGPIVGKIIKHLLECVLDDPAMNETGRLIEVARGYIEQLGATS